LLKARGRSQNIDKQCLREVSLEIFQAKGRYQLTATPFRFN
jgi:hypothetical protein